ncbi:MAG: UTP--glucose-1-phosphate uridylyltransferase [Pseudomonadota bacterium]
MIRKAVFPIAGAGTRFLPATKAIPKEMLPVVDKPLIQYAVEEAYQAGIRQMIFVTNHRKQSVADHFDPAVAPTDQYAQILRAITPDEMVCTWVRQPQPLGLGHAVLCAEPLVGAEPFAVLLADELMPDQPGITARMMQQFDQHASSLVAVQPVPREHSRRYGMIRGTPLTTDLITLQNIVEKPAPEDAPSDLAVVGRYLFTPAIFRALEHLPPGAGGEIQLTDAIARLLRQEAVLGGVLNYLSVWHITGGMLSIFSGKTDDSNHFTR